MDGINKTRPGIWTLVSSFHYVAAINPLNLLLENERLPFGAAAHPSIKGAHVGMGRWEPGTLQSDLQRLLSFSAFSCKAEGTDTQNPGFCPLWQCNRAQAQGWSPGLKDLRVLGA